MHKIELKTVTSTGESCPAAILLQPSSLLQFSCRAAKKAVDHRKGFRNAQNRWFQWFLRALLPGGLCRYRHDQNGLAPAFSLVQEAADPVGGCGKLGWRGWRGGHCLGETPITRRQSFLASPIPPAIPVIASAPGDRPGGIDIGRKQGAGNNNLPILHQSCSQR